MPTLNETGAPTGAQIKHDQHINYTPETPDASATAYRFTLITSSTGLICKTVKLGADEKLIKEPAAHMTDGRAEIISISSFDEFPAILKSLNHSQALVYGVPNRSGRVVSEKKLAKLVETGEASGIISRTKDNFFWPAGNGILFVDYDPPKNEQAMSRDELLAVLYGVCPALESAPHVWYPSASSCISRTDTGEVVAGIRGQRVYVGVADASDIERAGGVLFARLWLAGHGHIQISKSGSKLERGLVDDSVWQTNRLDFVAGSDCTGPLRQGRGEPMLLGGSETLNTRLTLPNLTTSETDKLIRVKAKAKADIEPEAEIVRNVWIASHGAELARRSSITVAEGEKIAREAVTSGRLMGDFVLISQDGDEVAVKDVLSNPDRWHGCRFYDPLEGRNYPDNRIAYLNLRGGGRPYVYSHAHGNCR